MNSMRKGSGAGIRFRLPGLSLLAVFLFVFITGGCGRHHRPPTPTDQFPGASANSETLEKMLKFDARVQDYEISGDKLIVNVNESWIEAPYGIKERATGQWFNMFRASQGNSTKELQVVVQHEGQEVGKWTPEHGFESAEGREDAKSGAHSAS
ncbi:MAG TPA: hypothetical protein VKC34_09480 [Blastocatellia bacterium]|nr:hypothetical protein [Blastocatellia bacterium]